MANISSIKLPNGTTYTMKDSSLHFEVLWQNSSPNSSFVEQKIDLPTLNNYDIIVIEFNEILWFIPRQLTSDNRRCDPIIAQNSMTALRFMFSRGVVASFSNNYIKFSYCIQNDSENPAVSRNDDRLIPNFIYGYNPF